MKDQRPVFQQDSPEEIIPVEMLSLPPGPHDVEAIVLLVSFRVHDGPNGDLFILVVGGKET